MPDRREEDITIGEVGRAVIRIETSISAMREEIRREYVTLVEFRPIQRIAYGLVAVMCLAVIGALLSMVLR